MAAEPSRADATPPYLPPAAARACGYNRAMNRWKALGFTLVFLVPAQMPLAAWLGARTGWLDAMCWFPLFFLFVMLPAVDYLLGHDPANVAPADERAVALNPWFR